MFPELVALLSALVEGFNALVNDDREQARETLDQVDNAWAALQRILGQ